VHWTVVCEKKALMSYILSQVSLPVLLVSDSGSYVTSYVLRYGGGWSRRGRQLVVSCRRVAITDRRGAFLVIPLPS